MPSYHLRGVQVLATPATAPGNGAATPTGATVTTDYWVSKATYFPVRIVSTSEGGVTVTLDFTSVNSGIAIERRYRDRSPI